MAGRLRRFFKRNFDIRKITDYDRIAEHAGQIQRLANTLFSRKPTSTTQETFAEAMQRLELTSEDIRRQCRNFYWLSRIFAMLALALYAYAGYTASQNAWVATGVSVGIGTLMVANAFRFHFWFFQTSVQQLGCTFADWWAWTWQGKAPTVGE